MEIWTARVDRKNGKRLTNNMKKAFTLPTCKTCVRIFEDLQPEQNGCEVVDIKSEGISAQDLDRMKELAGSYEALFSRRAM